MAVKKQKAPVIKFGDGGQLSEELLSKMKEENTEGQAKEIMQDINNKKIMKINIDPTIPEDSTITQLLQRQVSHEFDNERLYQAMALWCTHNGYPETARFYSKHTLEERRHGMDFINFMLKQGMRVKPPVPKIQPTDFKCMGDVIAQSMEREKETTRMIEEIHREALKEGNGAALTIAGKYLNEQVEEEQLFRSLANLFMMANGSRNDFEVEVMTLKNNKHKHKIGEL